MVHISDNYEKAKQILKSKHVDIMVTDICLSTLSESEDGIVEPEGFELIRSCRATFTKSRIIALTYHMKTTEQGAMALEFGADEFICGNWAFIIPDALLEQHLRIFHRLLCPLRRSVAPPSN